MRNKDLKMVGFALAKELSAWQFGWRKPMLTDAIEAGPADGDWWFCIGPLAFMFAED